eukprot:7921954-Pyramimonas_sp.AAC.1
MSRGQVPPIHRPMCSSFFCSSCAPSTSLLLCPTEPSLPSLTWQLLREVTVSVAPAAIVALASALRACVFQI